MRLTCVWLKSSYWTTNKERVKYGLKPLKWNEALARAARLHSEDMGVRDYFSHIFPEGEGPDDRVLKEGYNYTIVGENIFMLEGRSFITPDEFAEESVNGWMNSSGHRANILNGEFIESGVGIFFDQNGSKIYITAVYGRRISKLLR